MLFSEQWELVMEIKGIDWDKYRNEDRFGRCDGKTFRRLLIALYSASEGDLVYFIVNNKQMKSWTLNKMYDIVRSYMEGSMDSKSGPSDGISFPGGGEVLILSESEYENKRIKPTSFQDERSVVEVDDRH